jgi:hypothetical protein
MSSIFTGYKFVTRQEVIEARDGGIALDALVRKQDVEESRAEALATALRRGVSGPECRSSSGSGTCSCATRASASASSGARAGFADGGPSFPGDPVRRRWHARPELLPMIQDASILSSSTRSICGGHPSVAVYRGDAIEGMLAGMSRRTRRAWPTRRGGQAAERAARGDIARRYPAGPIEIGLELTAAVWRPCPSPWS